MIYVKYKGRLGNNLFQYALGRLLAEELGQNLVAAPIPGFPQTYDQVDGKRWNTEPLTLTGHRIPLSELLIEAPKRDIILNGYFQRYEYYKPFKERIRSWFAMPPPLEKTGKDDIMIFIRRGDYYEHNALLPYSFYEQIARTREYANIWVCSDDPHDPFIQRFCSEMHAKIRNGGTLEDFAFGTTATTICMSQSSYSWWIAFLSQANRVYCPVPGWTGDVDANYVVDDEQRYQYIRIDEKYQPTKKEKIWLTRQRWKRACFFTISLKLTKLSRWAQLRVREWKKTRECR